MICQVHIQALFQSLHGLVEGHCAVEVAGVAQLFFLKKFDNIGEFEMLTLLVDPVTAAAFVRC